MRARATQLVRDIYRCIAPAVAPLALGAAAAPTIAGFPLLVPAPPHAMLGSRLGFDAIPPLTAEATVGAHGIVEHGVAALDMKRPRSAMGALGDGTSTTRERGECRLIAATTRAGSTALGSPATSTAGGGEPAATLASACTHSATWSMRVMRPTPGSNPMITAKTGGRRRCGEDITRPHTHARDTSTRPRSRGTHAHAHAPRGPARAARALRPRRRRAQGRSAPSLCAGDSCAAALSRVGEQARCRLIARD